jgi:hypothetical protein
LKTKNKLSAWVYELQFFLKENYKGIAFAIIIFVALFFLFNNKLISKDRYVNKYPCHTNCDVLKVVPNKMITQGRYGNNVSTQSYKVTGRSYTRQEIIIRNTSNRELISSLQNRNENTWIARYKCANPAKSMIDLK